MFDIFRENPRKTLLILLIPALIACVHLALVMRYTMAQNDGNIGALLDDTWIHVRFADHIARGEGLSYNDGVLTTGATSPLWVLTLAGAFAVLNPPIMEQVNVAIMLSAIGHVFAVLAITGFGWWLTRREWVGLLAGILTALTGRFIWMGLSGMEITTFTLLCILALWSHTSDVRQNRAFGWRTGILTALATLARPEGYLLAVLIGGDAFVLSPLILRLKPADWIARVRAGWRGILAYILLAGSYPLASMLISGYPLPNTFRVKSKLGEEFPDLPRAFFWQMDGDYSLIVTVIMTLGFVFLLWLAWRSLQAWRVSPSQENAPMPLVVPLWAVLFVLGVLFLGADRFVVNNSRYVAPAIPFHALFAAIAVWGVVQLLTARRVLMLSPSLRSGEGFREGIIGVLSAILMGVVLITGLPQGAQVANDVSQLRKMHVAAGFWFIDATDPDDTIALNDVGAIVHISGRRVLDLEGLVSEEVIDATADANDYTCAHDLQLMRLMLKEPPALIGVFPWFYPCMTAWEGALQPLNVFTITGQTVIAGGELVVYVPVWENWAVQAIIPDEVTRLDASYEEGITLGGYTLDETDAGLNVSLWWQVSATPTQDYNISVHLIDENGDILAQGDGAPQNGQFFTSLWRAGDIIRDTHLIPLEAGLPAEATGIRIGIYTLDGSRPPLRRTDVDGDSALIPIGASAD
ncbi:MAG: hypothetical protein RLP44_16395 [Aggregatilineales bacterium]